jgi:hypothetical protein
VFTPLGLVACVLEGGLDPSYRSGQHTRFHAETIMHIQRTLAAAAISATLFLGAWRRHPPAPDACSLLTTAEVSAVLEVASQPGKHLVESSPKACIWSSDAGTVASGRRVTLSILAAASFNIGKSAMTPRVTIVPVTGIGDEAYYEVFTADSPFLVVRKGGTAFSIRILNGLKLKAFGLDQEKAKEADLAKAAAGRL